MSDLILNKMADQRVQYAMDDYKKENNKMGLYAALYGFGRYKLEIKPESGHNYYLIMEAIFRYYKNNPNSDIDKLYYNTLLLLANTCSNIETVSMFIRTISVQLDYQKRKICPFNVNINVLLKTFKETIQKNKELIKDSRFINTMNSYNDLFNEKYGIKIL